VDRHRFDADLDPNPNSHVVADPDPDTDPDWHQNNAILMRIIRYQVLNLLENQNLFLFLDRALPLYSIIFLISVKCVIIWFSILGGISKFSGKKSTISTVSFTSNRRQSGSRSGKIMRIRPESDQQQRNQTSRKRKKKEKFFFSWHIREGTKPT
jgi:hypothetical protein